MPVDCPTRTTKATCSCTNAPPSPYPESSHLLSAGTGGCRRLRRPDVRVARLPGPSGACHLPTAVLPVLGGSTAVQVVALRVGNPKRSSSHSLSDLDSLSASRNDASAVRRELCRIQFSGFD